MDLKTAFITGASSGIGLEVARRLARDGVEVVLAARRLELLEDAARAVREAGGKARAVALDVSDPRAVEAAVRKADDQVGGLDLVIANAGVGGERWAGKLDYDACEKILKVNLLGATATLTAVLPRMVERKRGHVVGVSSLAGARGLPRNAAYSASKAYLSIFLESLRVDLAGTGVAVTDVRPGFVKTPMTATNQFKMPFLVELEDAGAIIVKAIRARDAVCAFPLPMAAAVGGLRALPRPLFDAAARRARPRKG